MVGRPKKSTAASRARFADATKRSHCAKRPRSTVTFCSLEASDVNWLAPASRARYQDKASATWSSLFMTTTVTLCRPRTRRSSRGANLNIPGYMWPSGEARSREGKSQGIGRRLVLNSTSPCRPFVRTKGRILNPATFFPLTSSKVSTTGGSDIHL